MIDITRREIRIDGHPSIVMSGEVHYFRVAREEWGQRLDLLVEAGCDTVASYIPWLFHELPDGTIDVTGETRPERDIGAFIDLAASKGLRFLARPGPFIMAELKNEGIPFRVYRDHPEIVPLGWDGRQVPSRTVDYLAPAFLAESGRWFDAILPVLAARLEPAGGPIIGVQLDNEVGMLAWVTNSPDLTDGLLAAFGDFVRERHGASAPDRPMPYAVPPGAPGWAEQVRSPSEELAGILRVDLGFFMRRRFADYVTTLRHMCEDRGILGVPFFVNIHGTEGGNGAPFPIGISQLVDTYCRHPRHGVGVRPLPRRGHAGHDDRPLRHQRLHGRGPRRRPAADVARVRGRVGRLRRGIGDAVRPLDRRPQDAPVPRAGQPAHQLLPLRRRHQPASRREGG